MVRWLLMGMCWTLVPRVLGWLFLYPPFPFLIHQSEEAATVKYKGERFLLLGFKPVSAKCQLQTKMSWRGVMDTHTAGLG